MLGTCHVIERGASGICELRMKECHGKMVDSAVDGAVKPR
jgi:hypothetical protein